MTTGHDERRLREIADQLASDDPTVAAQLYADADYLAQLRKAPEPADNEEEVSNKQPHGTD
jgi:hypothetical protein